jgi:8-oxo-dGTP pyrophosphatase MutT (NUDIX family)
MDREQPVTREQLNEGPPTTPRPAAAVILLRDGRPPFELLLVQRNPAQRFMGGYWVFPGGAVDADDGDGDAAHRAAAVRELREEAGIAEIDAAELVKYARWITPELLRIRFDTHFFLARASRATQGRCDGHECVALDWSTPREALDGAARAERELAFPTLRQLEQLTAFASADELLAYARTHDVLAVRPLVALRGEMARLYLPGQPIGDGPPDAPASTG